MIITFKTRAEEAQILAVLDAARRLPDVEPRRYDFDGKHGNFTEVHLIGDTAKVSEKRFDLMFGVQRVIRVSSKFRVIGRHRQKDAKVGFRYRGLDFDESTVHVFAGLCAVDSRESVREMMAALQRHGLTTTRMGAYKPRTSPYDFQGLGADCLPYVFEEAGEHGIEVIAMEVCARSHIDEILTALEQAGQPTGVMLQIGTRNTQNFELLKEVGQQGQLPVLFKRGMGITLEESLNACEYVASEGQPNIIFCLRGVKSHLGDPHRNLVDFAHVPVVRSLTRLPVCIDPSHSVGHLRQDPDGVPDVFHVTGQGLISGASMVLVDFHPDPTRALCDAPQALLPEQLPKLLDYMKTMREAYLRILG